MEKKIEFLSFFFLFQDKEIFSKEGHTLATRVAIPAMLIKNIGSSFKWSISSLIQIELSRLKRCTIWT